MDKISHNTPYNNTPRSHVIYNPPQGVTPPPLPKSSPLQFWHLKKQSSWFTNANCMRWFAIPSNGQYLFVDLKCLLEACILISKFVYLVWGVLELFVK